MASTIASMLSHKDALPTSSSSSSSSKMKLPLSPSAPSPLTPPATGEAKATHTSSGSEGVGRERGKGQRRSASPCAQRSFPIRDSPRNPFLQGGAADAGFSGPRRWQAKERMAQIPKRERGKMTYVFRGQRVTYADPYASSDSEEEGEQEQGSGMMNNELSTQRSMDRLQPRLLFPFAEVNKNSAMLSSKRRQTALDALPASKRQRRTDDDAQKEPLKRPHLPSSVSAESQMLLQRLEHSGWGSDEGEEDEEDEEDEVDATVLASRSNHVHRTSGSSRSRQGEWQDSESEEDEAEENPFLDVAAPSQTTVKERSAIFQPSARQWNEKTIGLGHVQSQGMNMFRYAP